MLLLSALLLFTIGVQAKDLSIYKCSLCKVIVDRMVKDDVSFPEACHRQFKLAKEVCDEFKHFFPEGVSSSGDHSCTEGGFCPVDDVWYPPTDTSKLDVRVAKAHGGKNSYDKVRISVISNRSLDNPIFSYSAPFQYRWTDKVLNTGIVSVTPGSKTKFTIENEDVEVYLPLETQGTRGIIIADPCFMSQWVVCTFANSWNMFNNTVNLLNAATAHSDIDFWMVLGDNFYDQEGDATASFFSALSTTTKSKIFGATPGNHDFWVHSSPPLFVPNDQLGNGFMQYFAQDTAAATDKSPFDFSVSPDDDKRALPVFTNFLGYYKIGNTGFISFSGAHAYDDMKTEFTNACVWGDQEKLEHLILMSHWDTDDLGCTANSTTPQVFQLMTKSIPECANIASKMKYFEGHKHCNHVVEADTGFMVGAWGMGGCDVGQWGLPIMDTTDGTFKVYYFPLMEAPSRGPIHTTPGFDNFNTVYSCIQENGISGCYHLATRWA